MDFSPILCRFQSCGIFLKEKSTTQHESHKIENADYFLNRLSRLSSYNFYFNQPSSIGITVQTFKADSFRTRKTCRKELFSVDKKQIELEDKKNSQICGKKERERRNVFLTLSTSVPKLTQPVSNSNTCFERMTNCQEF